MTFLVVMTYGGVALCAVMLWRTWCRWRRIRLRPVLSCREFAEAEPGTFVVVAGRTAAGPGVVAPLSRRTCVWYEVTRIRTRVVSSNYEETERSVDEVCGDAGLYGPDGELARIDLKLGRRRLLAGRSAMVSMVASDVDGGRQYSTNSYDRLHEHAVLADTPIVATGVVRLADGEPGVRVLCRNDWVDGSVASHSGELPVRFARLVRWLVVTLLVFLVIGALLTGAR